MDGSLHQIGSPVRRVNVYRHNFTARCPINQEPIAYRLRIESRETIMAETIEFAVKAVAANVPPFDGHGLHEQIADVLHKAIGGKQRLTAWHKGVFILTVRG